MRATIAVGNAALYIWGMDGRHMEIPMKIVIPTVILILDLAGCESRVNSLTGNIVVLL